MPPSKRTSSSHPQNQTNHVANHTQTQNQNLKTAAPHDIDLMPQSSITVASRKMPVRARSVSSSSSGSPLSSSHNSPAQNHQQQPVTAKSAQKTSAELSKSTINSTSPKQQHHHHIPTSPIAIAADHTNGVETSDMTANTTTAPLRQKAQPVTSYEMAANLDEITLRQCEEDISAYKHDEAFCLAQLEDPDLTPQETRTLQLRILDLGHQQRFCRHRMETIQFQLRKNRPAMSLRPAYGGMGAPLIPASSAAATNGVSGDGLRNKAQLDAKHPSSAPGVIVKRNGVNGTPSSNNKRSAESEEADDGHHVQHGGGETKKIKTSSSPTPADYEMQVDGGGGGEDGEEINTVLQRLGFWKCRLCSAPKYLLAGSGRSPAAPCKWPLKDISKMITHFTEMHVEHSPSERCVELGSALAKNRGPFEYWLRRTRAQNIGDGTMLDDCILSLLQGEMPTLLRRHSRAAAGMPSE